MSNSVIYIYYTVLLYRRKKYNLTYILSYNVFIIKIFVSEFIIKRIRKISNYDIKTTISKNLNKV